MESTRNTEGIGESSPEPGRELAPVETSADRVARTVAGLRPYRASGFVVRTESLGDRTLVHNYGHGGAGVALSWGTAELAVDAALSAGGTQFAVVGAGAVGLATARLLQKRGMTVSLYARELPPDTTSNIAGALWYPASVYEERCASRSFVEQFTRACRISNHIFRDLVGERYGVRWLESYFLYETATETEFPGGSDLYPDQQSTRSPAALAGLPWACRFSTMMIDPTVYLDALLQDFRSAGGAVTVMDFESVAAVMALPEPVIVNCTGLGTKTLFGDDELVPVKGQLAMLARQPEIDYGYVAPDGELLYMFPRADEIVLGGTFEPDNWSCEVDADRIARILRGHQRIAADSASRNR